MKIGTENRIKTAIAVALAIVAVVLVWRAFHGGDESPPAPTAPVTASLPAAAQPRSANASAKATNLLQAKSLDPTLRFDLLKSSEDVTYTGAGRDIFRSQAEDVSAIPTPLTADKQPQKPAQASPPPPPPINLKFYGFAGPRNGNKRVFLLKGEDIFVAKEGDIVDRRYKIVHIGPNSVDVEDVLTNNRQTLSLSMG